MSESLRLFVLFDFKRVLFMRAHTHTNTVSDLMRQSDKDVRQKQQHLVHEPGPFMLFILQYHPQTETKKARALSHTPWALRKEKLSSLGMTTDIKVKR